MKEAKKYYDMLLENGDLVEVCPKAVGEWDKDKDVFKSFFDDMHNLVLGFEDGTEELGIDEFEYD